MKTPILLLFLFGLFCGQQGLQLQQDQKKIKIPFQLINNLILIDVLVNDEPLTLLLDTGVEETIIFSVENKNLSLKNIEKLKFTGLGLGAETDGYLSKNNDLRIGTFQNRFQNLYIILNQDFNFSSQVGVPINGIMGSDFFNNHPIKIDYISKKITIYQSIEDLQKKINKYQSLPMSFHNNKPYVESDMVILNEKLKTKLLIDSGNSDAVWVFPFTISQFPTIPSFDDYLGRGFNGDISGKKSRVKSLDIGSYTLLSPTVSLPEDSSIKNLNLAPNRNGSIGNEILKRFNLIVDYKNKTLYLQKNKNFNDPYLFNMSGLEFKHSGMQWEKVIVRPDENLKNTSSTLEPEMNLFANLQYKFQLKPIFAIAYCRPNSPADLVGLKKEDIIIAINGKDALGFTLQSLNLLMKSEEGKEIKMTIERNGYKKDYVFTLEDPIKNH